MSGVLQRLENPPFGTETSERELMRAAADEIKRLRGLLVPCIGWLEYAYGNVSSVTATAVKVHLPLMHAEFSDQPRSE